MATPTVEAPATEPTDDDDDDEIVYVPGVSYPKVAILVVVCALAAGALGWVLGERSGSPSSAGSAVDEGFVVDMRTHHQQAVEMALIQLGNGTEPEVHAYAREILVRQNVELGLMAAALQRWGIPTDRRPDTAMAWMEMPVPVAEMPGLASEEQMAAFRAAEGREVDRLFLDLMAEHHHGGVHMADYAAEHGDDEHLRSLARSMASIQAMEIGELAATARRLDLDAEIRPYVAGSDPFGS